MTVRLGTLDLEPARDDLLAPPVAAMIAAITDLSAQAHAVAIDPDLADTAALTDRFGLDPEASANCVIVLGKRGGELRPAACVVLASTRADVNGLVRRTIDTRKCSFAPQDWAVAETGMEYGGITPVGVPEGWPILIDQAVTEQPWVLLGSGLRRSKLALPGALLADLPGAQVLAGLGLR
ncbi:YbaK/EbsC family protein [Aeromicrobium sp.]|uniref:YbaK/EbsC family protein n=1 Tax=Aeromicrobium sp. TaxID=1871063 RepID=UPI0030C233D6